MWKKKAVTYILSAAMLVLAGCGEGALPGVSKSESGYTRSQILVIASTEKNRYEAVCGEEIWTAGGGSEETFEQYLTAKLHTFMDELKIMNLLAEEKGLSLTSQETAAMGEAASAYYGALTQEDISRMEISMEQVQELFEDYCMAEKLVVSLSDGLQLEVSDSEAKVVVIQQACFADRQQAEVFLAAVQEEGADFEKCAAAAGVQLEERSIGRMEEPAVYEEAAFALLTGEISSVIEAEGRYYVLKSVNDYDREATAARKEVIYKERRQKMFREIYDDYRQEITLDYAGDPFADLQISELDCAPEADFFRIYAEYLQ